ncbi:MAG: ribosome silencing factor [Clostridia bacterium]|nr:ribosome silencing factor [Clostridia bacterium]
MNSEVLVKEICDALNSKKAQDVVKINVTDKTCLADYFVVAGGRSTTQVRSLADNVEEIIEKKLGLTVTRREGVAEGRWAVLDYGDVIVHIFNDEQRLFYHLERLWGEGEKVD